MKVYNKEGIEVLNLKGFNLEPSLSHWKLKNGERSFLLNAEFFPILEEIVEPTVLPNQQYEVTNILSSEEDIYTGDSFPSNPKIGSIFKNNNGNVYIYDSGKQWSLMFSPKKEDVIKVPSYLKGTNFPAIANNGDKFLHEGTNVEYYHEDGNWCAVVLDKAIPSKPKNGKVRKTKE